MSDKRFETTPCRGCDKPIVWAVDDKGQRIPLDPRPPIYTVVGNPKAGPPSCLLGSRTFTDEQGQPVQQMVSHFATCPKADQFGRGAATAATRTETGPQALADMPVAMNVTSYGVYQWCPDEKGEAPPEQVHLRIETASPVKFALRMKSRRVVNDLIALLEFHRDAVWPTNDCEPGVGNDS